jgi:hypothetical protein
MKSDYVTNAKLTLSKSVLSKLITRSLVRGDRLAAWGVWFHLNLADILDWTNDFCFFLLSSITMTLIQ